MININSALITIWAKIKQLKEDVFSAISTLQSNINSETSTRENAITGLHDLSGYATTGQVESAIITDYFRQISRY